MKNLIVAGPHHFRDLATVKNLIVEKSRTGPRPGATIRNLIVVGGRA